MIHKNMAHWSEEKLQDELQDEENVNLNSSNNHVSSSDSFQYKSEKNNLKSKTCTYFFNYGHCKFGNDCKYLHVRNKHSTTNHNTFQLSKMTKICRERQYINNENRRPSNLFKNSSKQKSSQQICKYYNAGFCEKGDDCDFNHSNNTYNDEKYSSSFEHKKTTVVCGKTAKTKSVALCYYFKKGQCYKGDSCKYYHQNKDILNHSSANLSVVPIKTGSNQVTFSYSNRNSEESFETVKVHIAVNRIPVVNASSLNAEDISKLRETEIKQMKKRFPHHDILFENQIFTISFQPSDPDWPFDLKDLKIKINFPENYPKEMCNISVLQSAENIPQLLVKHLNKCIHDWINQKHEQNFKDNKVELIFRPFLKWFDRNLEELFISGLRKVKQDLKAKEDGIEFVPVENLFSTPEKSSADNITCTENLELVNEEQTQTSSGEDNIELNEVETQNSSEEISQPLHVSNAKSFENSNNNGFKIIFSELELIEGAAALMCTKISVTLHCSRCRFSFSMKSVPKKNNSHVCSKCSKNVGFVFEPCTIHQFSNVLGNLYVLDCLPVDINLVECHFLVDCLSCSKQVPVDGIHYGQRHKMWCIFCHEKMIMSVGSVKFQALKLESSPAIKYIPAKKITKKVKDPIVKEGEPLPNFGACKHYKKSYRWFRFPCCGRIYPCDECHNEKETDHEMKFASRMICGFCAKEQPYSQEKPCLQCSQNLIKKSGSHWEGGKGCRNKIQMSRVDKQKFSGISKTISKKAQNVKMKK